MIHTFRFHVVVDIPQLQRIEHIGEQVVANLSNISTALDQLSTTLDEELTAIHDALVAAQGPTQEEVDAVAQRVLELKDRIANIIP